MFHAGAPWEYTVHMNQEMRDLPKAVKEDVRGAYWNKLEERVLAVARRHHILENSVQVIEGHAADLLPPHGLEPVRPDRGARSPARASAAL